ncbi:MAG: A24 family peptidase [Gammaproteobacteria bacterium]|nr:A24 family peptidase [Gammaproteobacteria bacterium]
MDELRTLFQTFPVFLYTTTGILGLIVGSFLNVVIHRLPKMLENDWKSQCRSFLDIENQEDKQAANYNLVLPGSHCPHCGHQITALENIPIVSFLLQGGKCRGCSRPISKSYPLIEALSAILAVAISWRFGFGWPTLFALLLTWALIALTFIDLDHQLLPDNITLPFLWMGLFVNIFTLFSPLKDAVIGAIAGYLFLWTIFQLFKLATGKEGMGYGDFKLYALFGAWLGWQILPLTILMASFVGAIVGLFNILFRGQGRNQPIPFGPFLAAAGWVALMWGEQLNRVYLHIAKIPN